MKKKEFKKVRFSFLGLLILSLVAIWTTYFIQQSQIDQAKLKVIELSKEKDKLQKRVEEFAQKEEIIEKIASSREESQSNYKVEKEFFQNGNFTKTRVKLIKNDQEIAQFEDDSYSDSWIFKKTPSSLYVGLVEENRGPVGYETFHTLYRFDLQDEQFYEVRTQKTRLAGKENRLYIGDVSLDERLIAYVFEGSIIVEDFYSGQILKEFSLPGGYSHAGDLMFSPDGKKLAYGATTSYQSGEREKAAVFVLDVETGQRKEIKTARGGFFNILKWKGDNKVEYELLEY